MIKTRNLMILGVVLVVLGGVSLMQQSNHQKATSQASVTELLASGIVPDDLSRITLGYGATEEAVVLSNTPTGWTVDSAWQAKASQDRIDGLVRNLSGLTGEFRSDSGEVLADYGLGAEDAIHLRAFDPTGAVIMALEVGRKPERYPGNFVRQPDNNRVYVSQKNLLAQLGIYGDPELPESRYFLELQAVKEDRLAVDSMEIENGDGALALRKEFAVTEPDSAGAEPTLDRNTWEWRLDDDPAVALAKSKVDAVLNSLVAIRANDLVDPGADLGDYGLTEPSRRAVLHLADGRNLELLFGDDREAVDKAPAGTFMQVAGQPTVWVVTEYAVKNIFKTRDELQADQD